MRIEHIALWANDIEALRSFYATWFGATAGQRYENPAKGFASYFLSLADGPRLELMQRHDVTVARPSPSLGFAHIAISLGSESAVARLVSIHDAHSSQYRRWLQHWWARVSPWPGPSE